MSNANIPESAVAAYEADQKRYEGGCQDWSEFIHNHVDHQLWLIKEYGGKISKNMVEVLDTLRVMMMEDEKVCEFLEAVFIMDMQDAGFRLNELKEDMLERYCRNYADELQDMFPEEYAEWKETE